MSCMPVKRSTALELGIPGCVDSVCCCRGAKVLIANRNKGRAEQLASSMGSSMNAMVVEWEQLQTGAVKADVLANTTSVGMAPKVHRRLRSTGIFMRVILSGAHCILRDSSAPCRHMRALCQHLPSRTMVWSLTQSTRLSGLSCFWTPRQQDAW